MSRPGSYANGFAPRDGQPLYPELWRGCVGAWAPCLGPTGLTLRDWSGRGHNGPMISTMSPSTGWDTSHGRWSNKFDGSDDYFDLMGSLGSFSFVQNSGAFTISWWQKMSSLTVRMVPMGNTATTAEKGWLPLCEYGAGVGTNSMRFALYKGTLNIPIYDVRTPDGTLTTSWQHICVSGSGISTGRHRIYIDGVEQSLTVIAAFTAYSSGDSTRVMNVGRTNFSSTVVPFSGWLDDLRIYDRPLSENTVRAIAFRRGIAYELAPRRRSSSAVAAFNRRRRLLVGASS